jgi:tetratricopeptide (TPR) repeat protein
MKSLIVLVLLSLFTTACGKSVKNYVEEADILVAQNRMDEAIILYQKAIQDHSKNPILYINQAVLFREQQKYDLALKNYQIAHELNQDSAIPLVGMGRVMMMQSRFSEARDILLEAIKLDPNHPLALYLLGNAYLELKEGDKAIQYLNKALLAHYKAAEIYYNRGRVYEDLYHDPQRAITEYENYLKANGPKGDEVKLRIANLAKS